MKTLLVTGPIGSGKSEVCRYMASKGLPVYDCDSRTKALYEKIPDLKSRIEKALEIDWSEIRIIFKDARKREMLEAIVYPLLLEDIRKWKSALEALDFPMAIIESAIAMDKPILDGLYDEVLLVNAPLETRLKRNPDVAARNSLQNFDAKNFDYIIENDSDIETLHDKVNTVLSSL